MTPLIPALVELCEVSSGSTGQAEARIGGWTVGVLTWRDRVITGIFVLEPYRRRGVATRLLAQARDACPELAHSGTMTAEGEKWARATGFNGSTGKNYAGPARAAFVRKMKSQCHDPAVMQELTEKYMAAVRAEPGVHSMTDLTGPYSRGRAREFYERQAVVRRMLAEGVVEQWKYKRLRPGPGYWNESQLFTQEES